MSQPSQTEWLKMGATRRYFDDNIFASNALGKKKFHRYLIFTLCLRLNAIRSGDVIEMLSANQKAIILLLWQLPINSLKSASKSNLSKKTADLVVRLVLIGFEPSPPIAKLLLSESLPLRTRC